MLPFRDDDDDDTRVEPKPSNIVRFQKRCQRSHCRDWETHGLDKVCGDEAGEKEGTCGRQRWPAEERLKVISDNSWKTC